MLCFHHQGWWVWNHSFPSNSIFSLPFFFAIVSLLRVRNKGKAAPSTEQREAWQRECDEQTNWMNPCIVSCRILRLETFKETVAAQVRPLHRISWKSRRQTPKWGRQRSLAVRQWSPFGIFRFLSIILISTILWWNRQVRRPAIKTSQAKRARQAEKEELHGDSFPRRLKENSSKQTLAHVCIIIILYTSRYSNNSGLLVSRRRCSCLNFQRRSNKLLQRRCPKRPRLVWPHSNTYYYIMHTYTIYRDAGYLQ